jgi:3-mercaptopyruvate sulfurtransferase SseA
LPELLIISILEAAVDHYLNSIPSDYYSLGTVASSKRLMVSSDPFLVDVRTLSEYQAGHIIGAINLPLQELDRCLEAIPTDQEPD